MTSCLIQKTVGPLQQHLRLNVLSINTFNEALLYFAPIWFRIFVLLFSYLLLIFQPYSFRIVVLI